MPCYQVRMMSVEFKAENRDLLDAALKLLGWKIEYESSGYLSFFSGRIVIDLSGSRATVEDDTGLSVYQNKLNELKRAYSRQSINAAAKKAGWQVSSSLGVATSGKLIRRVN